MFKVSVDKEKCIGCGACTAACDNFVMNEEENKAEVKQAEVEDIGCNNDGKDACPTEAIIIEEK